MSKSASIRFDSPVPRLFACLGLSLLFAVSFAARSPAEALDAADRDAFVRLFTGSIDVPVGEKTDRFDYQSLDPTTGRLYVAKMGSAKLLVFDIRNRVAVAELDGFPKVTGVLAVPGLHKVYASVPGAGLGASISVALGIAGLTSGSAGVTILDSGSLRKIAELPGGVFPDGIAYDPDDERIFVSDELGGAVEMIDAQADKVLARIDIGGEVGNVQYDRLTKKIYVPVQTRDELAVIDPEAGRLVDRYPLPGGHHPHGLRMSSEMPIAYIACDGDDRLLVVDLGARRIIGVLTLGHDPDVLAGDAGLKRLYVASESGTLSVFDIAEPAAPRKLGDAFVGADAHSVAVDPASHLLFLPLRDVNGRSAIRILEPVQP